MQWSALDQAGFTAGEPWIAVNPNHDWLNAEAEYGDPGSVFNHYRRLIELRHTNDVVVDGTFAMLVPDDPDLYVFTRTLDRQQILVAANLSGNDRRIELGGQWRAAPVLIGNYPDDGAPESLRPWEARVLQR